MKCAEFQGNVVHVLLGQATPALDAALREHARVCRACADEMAQIGGLLTLVREASAAEASHQFRPRLRHRVERQLRVEEEELLRSAAWKDRALARAAYVSYRIRTSTSVQVTLAAAAVMIAITAFTLLGEGDAARPPADESARLPNVTNDEDDPRDQRARVTVPAPLDAPKHEVAELQKMVPPMPRDVIEPPPSTLPPIDEPDEPLEPFSVEVAQAVRDSIERDNQLVRMRFLMRDRFDTRVRGTPVDRAVVRSMKWIADQQEDDGSWDPEPFGGEREARVGATALCVLAYLANAERGVPGGLYRRHVQRGLDYLRSQRTEDGTLGAVRGDADVVVFNHAVATLAFVENWVLTKGEQDEALIADALERLEILGWRRNFRERQNADNITAPWVALALETARAAGVPTEVQLDRVAEDAQSFVAKLVDIDPTTGRVLLPSEHLCALACASALDSLFDEVNDFDRYQPPLDLLLTHLAVEQLREPTKIFFAALDVYRRGARDWQTWNDEATRILLSSQAEDGSWSAEFEWDPVQAMGGDLYETAVFAMTLSIPQRVGRSR